MTTPELEGLSLDELRAKVAALQGRVAPVRTELARLEGEADAVRGEIRRRERLAQVDARREVRSRLGAGEMPTLEDVVAGADLPDTTRFDDLTYVRDSATEVRVGYAAAAHQEVSFTDGASTSDAADLGTARGLWRAGWEFGTAAARGVRVYPAGSRAEKMLPAAEVHVRLPS
ncbi:MAG TPA: hypothetical protein VGR61_03520 [Candidatus Dormibacteraeota bacterium]|nr:hypothetical protein [Candidatus Dormibacteraeota bacterium]